MLSKYVILPNPAGKGWLCLSRGSLKKLSERGRSVIFIGKQVRISGKLCGVAGVSRFSRAVGPPLKGISDSMIWDSPFEIFRAFKIHGDVPTTTKRLSDGFETHNNIWDTEVKFIPTKGIDLCLHVLLT